MSLPVFRAVTAEPDMRVFTPPGCVVEYVDGTAQAVLFDGAPFFGPLQVHWHYAMRDEER